MVHKSKRNETVKRRREVQEIGVTESKRKELERVKRRKGDCRCQSYRKEKEVKLNE